MHKSIPAPARLLAVLLLVALPWTAAAEEDGDLLAEMTELLELTDEQVPQVEGVLQKFVADMDAAAAMAEVEEPDNQAIIGAVNKARSGFRKGMEGALTDEQYQTLETTIDAVFQEIFEDLAEIRIIDWEPVLGLTPEQTAALKPILGSSLRKMIGVVFEYGDKRMGARTKIKMGKSLKRIKSDLDQGIAGVLDDEQMAKYQAMMAEAKG